MMINKGLYKLSRTNIYEENIDVGGLMTKEFIPDKASCVVDSNSGFVGAGGVDVQFGLVDMFEKGYFVFLEFEDAAKEEGAVVGGVTGEEGV
jgi:hypothetical protein